ncbi:hypothetical protein [Mesorhizobium sp. 2RAF21]|uniref:hypothetical protein n=1 Tax=Mesorhizobium sp. 2RAF21 TaxID=3232995 RepID=UPI003F989425
MLKLAMIDRRVAIYDEEGKKNYKRISDIVSEPFVVLLGEPGMGKSSVFEGTARLQGLEPITVRQLLNGAQIDPTKRLYADSFDEYRSDGREADKACLLAETIKGAKLQSWWLSCRGQDWRELSDLRELQRSTGDGKIVVASLEPLDRFEAAAVLEALGAPEPLSLVKQVEKIGAPAFLENPLLVRLLYEAWLANGAIPPTRFEIYQAAIRQMAEERNPDYAHVDRNSVDERISAAAKACLIQLTTGASAIWRSNLAVPRSSGDRPPLTRDDLALNSKLLMSTLDTALFRGEGSLFQPAHRSIAEFLGAMALAAAVNGDADHAALPLSRAMALICGPDGMPPSALRGLFAWVAAHLGFNGDFKRAAELIERDPITVLSYGDAAVLGTEGRKLLLDKIDRDDPYAYFMRGVTTIGALAGEDLAEEFRTILTTGGTSAKLHAVLSALTVGRPVKSLEPLLRNIAYDRRAPNWLRLSAVDAWLNGADHPNQRLRQLLETLSEETASADREELRASIAARLPATLLPLNELKAILRDFERVQRSDHGGGLHRLDRQLRDYPRPELFNEPVSNWRDDTENPPQTSEVNHLLERALAAAITGEPTPDGEQLLTWLNHVSYGTSAVDDVRKAIQQWLDAAQDRDVSLAAALIASDDTALHAWMI